MADKRWLRRRLERVKVYSCADGSFGINALWREPYARRPKNDPPDRLEADLPPGLFTRMATADELERIINRALGADNQTPSL